MVKRFFIYGIVFCFLLLGWILLIRSSLSFRYGQIAIPESIKMIYYYEPAKVVLTGPLALPRSLASNVLGLVHVAPMDIIYFVNKARIQAGSSELKSNSLLTQAADMRAKTILRHQNFSHQDPYENIQLDTVIPKVGYTFSYISENIGLGEQGAESFVNGFLDSPPHKQNLLDKQLVDTGVGVASGKFGDRDVTIVVQIFGVPTSTAVARGYPDNEENNLREILAGLYYQNSLTDKYLESNINLDYYKEWKNLLSKQITIVREVLRVVEKQNPYTEKERKSIAEYNQNWILAPR